MAGAHPILFRVISVAIGLLGGLILLEATLSALNLPTFHKSHSFPPQFTFVRLADGTFTQINSPNREIPFTYDSDPRRYFGADLTVRHYTNSMGFRAMAEPPGPKAPGTRRIVFLGDSFTFGEGVEEEDVFSARVSVRMNAARAGGHRYEVFNLGVGGYNTEQEVALLRNFAIKLQPDVVVLVYTLNDAEPKLFEIDPVTQAPRRRSRDVPENTADPLPPAYFPFTLRSARLIWKVAQTYGGATKTLHYYRSLYDEGREGWQATQGALRDYGNICRLEELKCYVALFPLLVDFADYPFVDAHRKVSAAAGAAGVELIDLLPPIAELGLDGEDLWVHPTDQHPNELVHREVADSLIDRLTAEFEK